MQRAGPENGLQGAGDRCGGSEVTSREIALRVNLTKVETEPASFHTRRMAAETFNQTREFLQKATESFVPTEELEIISKIRNVMRETEEAQKKQSIETRDILLALNRQLELTKQNATRPKGAPDEMEQSDRMLALDREKYALAKGINQVEQSVGALEATLHQLREEMAELDREEEEEKDIPPDETLLKLHLCRQLGIDLVEDGCGNFTKARIVSKDANDVRTLVFDDKYSPFFSTNYLWEQ
ncbi:uncharacterized protein VTP21DRAFT_4708 [Calcarisporiella thermophila]|uniref:uncharacterized protein n=1 Tax=Calcarisporiella thermophila TaxID=911321 RepID=UPI003742DCE0